MLTEIGFIDIEIGPPVDTFGGAHGEANARTFEVYGHAFLARKPNTPEGEAMTTVADTTPA